MDCREKERGGGYRETYGEEKIANIMRNIHRQPHIREVEPVAQPNQRQGHNVMRHQDGEILPSLLQPQAQHDGLLRPVTRLQQVVRLEQPVVRPVWEPLVHTLHPEIPHWGPVHDVEAQGPENAEITGRVHLFHETELLLLGAEAMTSGHGAEDALHKELTREGEEDGVEGDKGKVLGAFAIMRTHG